MRRASNANHFQLSIGVALGETIPKVTTLPDTWWIHALFAGLFVGAAGWLVMRLAARCVRPFVRRLIERTAEYE